MFVSGGVFPNEISPLSAEVYVMEGSSATLSCNYSATNILAFQWYRQHPDSAPEGFTQGFENTIIHTYILRFTVQKELKRLDLEIFFPAKRDSALYYCALVTTVRGKPGPLHKNTQTHTFGEQIQKQFYLKHNTIINLHCNKKIMLLHYLKISFEILYLITESSAL